jgi:hypothetical protein
MHSPVSGKGAKYAKVAKQQKDFAFAFLHAFVRQPTDELFWFFHAFLAFPQVRRRGRTSTPRGRPYTRTPTRLFGPAEVTFTIR